MNRNLIASFVQTKVMAHLTQGSRMSEAAKSGACHNFTIEWLSLMVQNTQSITVASAKDRMNKLSSRCGAGNPVLQKVFGMRWKENKGRDFMNADEMMISIRGLKRSPSGPVYERFNLNAIANGIKNPSNPGLIYSFWFKGGGHTIGFFRSLQVNQGSVSPENAYVSAFDPNFGEYQIPVNQFETWFKNLQQKYGGSYSKHMIKWVSKR